MRTAHLQCDDGITAQRCLAALVDAGVPGEALQEPLDRAAIGARLRVTVGIAREVRASRVEVETDPDAPRLESPARLAAAIRDAKLPDRAAERAQAMADALAGAEAAVHGVPVDDVRFHELGRPRTAATIVAVAAALEYLDVERVTVGPVALGGGTVHIAHGRFPVPPPAVLELLAGFTVYGEPDRGELTTPSGAAVLAALAEPVDAVPPLGLETYGRGATGQGPGARLLTTLVGTAAST